MIGILRILGRMNKEIRRAASDIRGATMVEFGFVVIPAMMTISAIVQIGLSFFMFTALDRATDIAGRNLMTGATQLGGYTASQVQAQICNNLSSMFTCSNVFVSITTMTAPAYVATLASPYKSAYYNYVNSNVSGLTPIPLSATNDAFNTTAAIGNCWLVVIQVAYPAPFYFSVLTPGTPATFNGQAVNMLTSATTFVTEPFPGSTNTSTTGC